MSNYWCDPWHTLELTVKTTHYHEAKDRPGHTEADADTWGETWIEAKDLTHPDSCEDIRKDDFDFRCSTEYDVMEMYDELDGPMESGTYWVRSSGSGPDYEDDYDAHTDFKPVVEGVEP